MLNNKNKKLPIYIGGAIIVILFCCIFGLIFYRSNYQSDDTEIKYAIDFSSKNFVNNIFSQQDNMNNNFSQQDNYNLNQVINNTKTLNEKYTNNKATAERIDKIIIK
jgi:hypothetical protein